jgi:hypothetical protein
MPDLLQLDRTLQVILETLVERGYAPHYTELAARFGTSPEEAKGLLRDLVATGLPIWLYPGTDLIASCAPFNNQPTQYRLGVGGRTGWFGQCGLEALAACWAFPGQPVQIESPCLDCGEPLRVVVRDGVIEEHEPAGIVSYVELPLREWAKDWPFT